eukprot:1140294-Pelagomonas_calceolata.AAC.5
MADITAELQEQAFDRIFIPSIWSFTRISVAVGASSPRATKPPADSSIMNSGTAVCARLVQVHLLHLWKGAAGKMQYMHASKHTHIK